MKGNLIDEVFGVGHKILKSRVLFGLTQEEMAVLLKVSKQAYSRWEMQDYISPERLSDVARVLGVTSEFIEKCDENYLFFVLENARHFGQPDQTSIECNNNAMDKVVELYERLLSMEQFKVRSLMATIESMRFQTSEKE